MKVRKKVRNRALKGKARRGTLVITEVDVEPRSPYVGSVLTVDNRREFINAQKKVFIDNQLAMAEAKRDAILAQEGTDEEIQAELDELASKTLSTERLEHLGEQFGIFQANKESKHYKAYLKGLTSFKYKGRMFPVQTEEFLLKAKEYQEIITARNNSIEQENQLDEKEGIQGSISPGESEGQDIVGHDPDNEGGNGETIRSLADLEEA